MASLDKFFDKAIKIAERIGNKRRKIKTNQQAVQNSLAARRIANEEGRTAILKAGNNIQRQNILSRAEIAAADRSQRGKLKRRALSLQEKIAEFNIGQASAGGSQVGGDLTRADDLE